MLIVCSFCIKAQISFTDNSQNISTPDGWNINLIDIENDGDLDAYFEKKLWINDGNGNFKMTEYSFTQAYFPTFADLNGDSLVDIIALDSIFINKGGYNFSFFMKLESDISMVSSVVYDIDNDNDLDIISCSSDSDVIFLNNGENNFINSKINLGGWAQSSYAFGDINCDGYTDIYVAIPHKPYPVFGHAKNQIVYGNKDGNFVRKEHDILDAESRGIILEDFDIDGDLDLYVSDRMKGGLIWFNDGKGNLKDSEQLIGNHPGKVCSADFDNDGDLDLFICQDDGNIKGLPFSEGAPNALWLNNGKGIFTDSKLRLGNSNSTSLAIGDLNNDNRTDAFVVNVKLDDALMPPKAIPCIIEVWIND
jgi:hypothetical protein